MISSQRLTAFAPLVLRLGLAAVFTWFGVSQWVNPAQWIGLVPEWATPFDMSATTLVHFNGTFEIIFALLLALGIYVRWVALALAVHLIMITVHLGMTPVGVRDFGLSLATLASALFGQDEFSLKS